MMETVGATNVVTTGAPPTPPIPEPGDVVGLVDYTFAAVLNAPAELREHIQSLPAYQRVVIFKVTELATDDWIIQWSVKTHGLIENLYHFGQDAAAIADQISGGWWDLEPTELSVAFRELFEVFNRAGFIVETQLVQQVNNQSADP